MSNARTYPRTATETVREHLACLDWAGNRRLVITRQIHGFRETLNLRVWNRHQQKNVWYPTKRGMVIGLDKADRLGEALLSIAHGELTEPKPAWLLEWEAEQASA